MLLFKDDYIAKFKHTLQHLAREWYHGLHTDQFGSNWHTFTQHISVGTSLPKAEILNIYMKGGDHFPLIQTQMTEEYIHDVREAAKQLGHGDDAVLNLLKATMCTDLYGTLYGYNNLYIVMTMLKDIYPRSLSLQQPQLLLEQPKEPQLLSPSSAPLPEILLKPLMR